MSCITRRDRHALPDSIETAARVCRTVADINQLVDLMYQSSIFWNRQGVDCGVMGGIDIALYDLLGKLFDLPVYKLLGGRCRPHTRIDASGSCLADIHMAFATPERLMTDYCFMDHPFNDLISTKPLRPIDRFAMALDAPGLAVSFDRALLKDYPYDPTVNAMIPRQNSTSNSSRKTGIQST